MVTTGTMIDVNPRNQEGFTLLELLIGLVLLAVLTLILLQALHATTHVATRSLNQARDANIETVRTFIRRTIEQAVLPRNHNKFDKSNRLFIGRPKFIEFISGYSVMGQLGGMRRYRLRLDPSPKSKTHEALILQWASYRPKVATQDILWRSEILLQNVSSIDFKYLDDASDTRTPVWRENWLASRPLPAAISINLVTTSSKRQSTPPVIVRLQLRRTLLGR